MEDMEFEWDDAKEQANIRKHGISFETAALVFTDEHRIEYRDENHSGGEDRYATIGIVGDVIIVIYTMRKETYRIISARAANRKERNRYLDGY